MFGKMVGIVFVHFIVAVSFIGLIIVGFDAVADGITLFSNPASVASNILIVLVPAIIIEIALIWGLFTGLFK